MASLNEPVFWYLFASSLAYSAPLLIIITGYAMTGQNTIVITNIVFVDVFYDTGDLFVEMLFLLGQDRIVDYLSRKGMFKYVGESG